MYYRPILFSITLFTVLILAGFQSCSTYNKEVSSLNLLGDLSVEGSWTLSKYMEDGGSVWKSYGPEIIYQKHITPTHFTWFKYNTATDILEGAGGGTYKFEESTYTEYIEFFHPPGSSLIGQAIPFDVKIEDGIWYHTGYTKELEFDPASGELLIVDTTKIEEQWKRINRDMQDSSQNILVNTWDLVGYKTNLFDSTYNEYPDFVGYLKLITPTNFTWIKYYTGSGGGEVIGLGSGTWKVGADKYIEKIDVMYPSGSNQVRTEITFDMNLQDPYWYHTGYIKRMDFSKSESPVLLDSSLVDELWELVPVSEQ